MNFVVTILQILVAAVFFLSAALKLLNAGATTAKFVDWGYPAWFMYVVAGVELVAAIALLVPKTAQAAAGALILLMLGAAYTHFSRGGPLVAATPALVLLVMLGLIVVLRRRADSAISL